MAKSNNASGSAYMAEVSENVQSQSLSTHGKNHLTHFMNATYCMFILLEKYNINSKFRLSIWIPFESGTFTSPRSFDLIFYRFTQSVK